MGQQTDAEAAHWYVGPGKAGLCAGHIPTGLADRELEDRGALQPNGLAGNNCGRLRRGQQQHGHGVPCLLVQPTGELHRAGPLLNPAAGLRAGRVRSRPRRLSRCPQLRS